MARYQPGSDATAARKLTRSEPLSGRNARADETPRRSSSIERLKPGVRLSRACTPQALLLRARPKRGLPLIAPLIGDFVVLNSKRFGGGIILEAPIVRPFVRLGRRACIGVWRDRLCFRHGFVAL
jgi:hypothetical protein